MRLSIILLCLVGGCSLLLDERDGGETGTDGGATDGGGGIDGNGSGDDEIDPFGSIPTLRRAQLPANEVTIEAPCELKTSLDQSNRCDFGGAAQLETHPGDVTLFVVRASRITISSTVTLTGDFPLALIAERIEVTASGHVEAGSDIDAVGGGPGNRACGDVTTNGALTIGAGGGGFGGPGGLGGGGGPTLGNGGMSVAEPSELMGGCAGGDNGSRLGGRGGGAVQLSAFDEVRVAGSINVGGAGGRGGTIQDQGGAGGGAGGLIILEAAMVLPGTQLAVYGGAGGGAGTDAVNGQDGTNGTALGPGENQNNGNPGGGTGAGGPLVKGTNGTDPSAGTGGGGGGGGGGFRLIRDPTVPK